MADFSEILAHVFRKCGLFCFGSPPAELIVFFRNLCIFSENLADFSEILDYLFSTRHSSLQQVKLQAVDHLFFWLLGLYMSAFFPSKVKQHWIRSLDDRKSHWRCEGQVVGAQVENEVRAHPPSAWTWKPARFVWFVRLKSQLQINIYHTWYSLIFNTPLIIATSEAASSGSSLLLTVGVVHVSLLPHLRFHWHAQLFQAIARVQRNVAKIQQLHQCHVTSWRPICNIAIRAHPWYPA